MKGILQRTSSITMNSKISTHLTFEVHAKVLDIILRGEHFDDHPHVSVTYLLNQREVINIGLARNRDREPMLLCISVYKFA